MPLSLNKTSFIIWGMGKIEPITKSVNFSKNIWKNGMSAGALTGIIQGMIGMFGVHQFFSRLIGGATAQYFVKKESQKEIINLEASREATFQLLAGD